VLFARVQFHQTTDGFQSSKLRRDLTPVSQSQGIAPRVLSSYTLQSFLVPLASGSVVCVGRDVQGFKVAVGKSLKSIIVVGGFGIHQEVVEPPVTAAYPGYVSMLAMGDTPSASGIKHLVPRLKLRDRNAIFAR
jgi:hypothetical protein